MARVSTARLAAAVSEAGGLGIIGAGLMKRDELRDEIVEIKKLTSRPFGVNVILTAPDAADKIEAVIERKVPVLTIGAGNAGPIIRRAAGTGISVIPVVASVSLAVREVRAGAVAIIAEGYESGGHVGESTTMALVAMVTRAISVPVIAAGGIADGKTAAAAFALGAEGIQMGTAFLVAKECTVHDNYKRRIIGAGDRDTVVTGRSTGHPVRIIRNRLASRILKMEKAGATPEEIFKLGDGALARAVEGDTDEGSVMAGQIAGLVDRERSAKEIVEGVMADAEETIRALNQRIRQ